MKSFEAALNQLCNPEKEVSSHYLVDENGDIYELVDPEKRAWHAGISEWRGQKNLNDTSIGIEIVNPGHEFGYRPFPDVQINAVLDLCKKLTHIYKIPAKHIIGHSDIAPDRKDDPGELFPWKKFSAHKIGDLSKGSKSRFKAGS